MSYFKSVNFAVLVSAIVAVSATALVVMNSPTGRVAAVNPSVKSSEVGANYGKLQDLLKAGKWENANSETTRLMLWVAYRGKEVPEVWIDPETMAKFPCTDLRTINRLWVESSKGRLGFSVQRRIYEQGGKDWLKFNERLGWYSPSGDLDSNSLTEKPKDGGLPLITREIGWPSLTQRLGECGIQ
ncbi:MAG: GUN4 domain-containing protein [Microcoleus vaginatus WJT46-NPBG5]|jgi:hypothetical protein|nr:GUN4 domain-containing protein [Microcoleus vaginatus WJT46-NPBG5]